MRHIKPELKDAPEGAKWLVRNGDGSRALGMYADKPIPNKSRTGWKYRGPYRPRSWKRVMPEHRRDPYLLHCEKIEDEK